MSRAAVDDLMQGFRFHVVAQTAAGENPLEYTRSGEYQGGGQAGFTSATIPELSVEVAEYREGTFQWTQKYAGVPTVSDVSLMRGVAKKDTAFLDWVRSSVDGEEYRCDVTIYHYQRTEMGQATQSDFDDTLRRMECKNCVPIRGKASGDFDSTASEVSVSEVDFALESFEIKTA